jgi:hypothetical protein
MSLSIAGRRTAASELVGAGPKRLARVTYTIEFNAKRALDDMIIARSILDQLSLCKVDPDGNNPEKIANAAIKVAQILVALDRAAGECFRSKGLAASRRRLRAARITRRCSVKVECCAIANAGDRSG